MRFTDGKNGILHVVAQNDEDDDQKEKEKHTNYGCDKHCQQ